MKRREAYPQPSPHKNLQVFAIAFARRSRPDHFKGVRPTGLHNIGLVEERLDAFHPMRVQGCRIRRPIRACALEWRETFPLSVTVSWLSIIGASAAVLAAHSGGQATAVAVATVTILEPRPIARLDTSRASVSTGTGQLRIWSQPALTYSVTVTNGASSTYSGTASGTGQIRLPLPLPHPQAGPVQVIMNLN